MSLTVTAPAAPRVLVIGATGSLGQEIVRSFQNTENGYTWDVVGTFRSGKDGEQLNNSGVTPLRLDVTDTQRVRALAQQLKDAGIDKLDAVVVNAGILKGTDRRDFFRVNADGPEAVVRALAEYREKRIGADGKEEEYSPYMPSNLLLVSSQLVGGPDAAKQDPEDRYSPGGPSERKNSSDYGDSKAAGEALAYMNYQMATTRYWLAEVPNHPGCGKLLHRSSPEENRLGFNAFRFAGILGPNDTTTSGAMFKALRGAFGLIGAYPNIANAQELRFGWRAGFGASANALWESAKAFLGLSQESGEPRISVISAHDAANVIARVAAENLINPRFGIYDVENGQNGIGIPDIVSAGKTVFGTSVIFTPRVPLFYSAVAFVEELRRKLFKSATTVDNSRVAELGHPELSTTNDRLLADYPKLRSYRFQRFADILAELAKTWGIKVNESQ